MEFFFTLILTWIIVYLMVKAGKQKPKHKWTEEDSFKNRKSALESAYKNIVEGARSGDLRCKRLKREYEEAPEFKEYGITPIEL